MTDSPPSDDQLLAAARAGNAQALEELLDRHQAQVYRFGMKMCRDPEDAKDVLQDTLLTVARGIRDFRGGSALTTWLYTIARNFCLKKRRRSQYAPSEERSLDTELTGAAKQLADPRRAPDDALAGKQVEAALEAAVASLDPMYREVLLLRDVEGLSAPEVAEVVGASVQAVKSRLHRARLSVREKVAPWLGVTPGLPPAGPATCPDVVTLFSRHLEGEISADLCAEMEAHLEACGRCRGACESLKRTLALCRTSTGATDVPGSVQDSVRAALRHCAAEKS